MRLAPNPIAMRGACMLVMILFTAPYHSHASAEPSGNLDTVVVTGTRTSHKLADTPVDTSVISNTDIERSVSRTVSGLLQSVPGYSGGALDDALGADSIGATMRGLQLNEGYGLILVDGLRVHGGLGAHGDYGVSVNQIPVDMIERIEVVRGASSALYGADAMAGVINIITRRVPEQRTGSVGADYEHYRMQPRGNEDPVQRDRVANRVYATFGDRLGERSAYYLHVTHEQDEGIDAAPARTEKQSFRGKWHTALTPDADMDIELEYGRARREAPGDIAGHDRRYDTYRLSSDVAWALGAQDVKIRGSIFRQDFTQGYPGFAHGFREGAITYYQAETVHHWQIGNQTLTSGVEMLRQELDYDFRNYPADGQEQVVPVRENINAYSAFLQNEIDLYGGDLVLIPGARLERRAGFGTELSPKLGAMYRIGTDTTVRGSVGRAFKTPTMRQLYYQGLYRHGDYYTESNPDLDPETATSWNVSIDRNLPSNDSWISVGAFRTDVQNMVVLHQSDRIASDGIPIRTYVNVDSARVQGLEASVRSAWRNGISLTAGVNWTHAKDQTSDTDLPFVPRYSATFAPAYYNAQWRAGISSQVNWSGRQYRSANASRPIDRHGLVNLKAWKDVGQHARLTVDAGNILKSDRGEAETNWRMGRSLSLGLHLTL